MEVVNYLTASRYAEVTPTAKANVSVVSVMEDSDLSAQLKDSNLQKAFVLAGNAIFTLVSQKTGTRFTFKVSKAKANAAYPNQLPTYFVLVLTGSSNYDNYSYIGLLQDALVGYGIRQTRG